jgi:hypothetical protein
MRVIVPAGHGPCDGFQSAAKRGLLHRGAFQCRQNSQLPKMIENVIVKNRIAVTIIDAKDTA